MTQGIPSMAGEKSVSWHKARHIHLHQAFDELLADYLLAHPKAVPSTTTCTELMKWSHAQTLEPDSLVPDPPNR